MAETAGTLTSEISRRVRDPNNTAHLAADIRTLLTHAQRIINTHTQALVVEETLSFVAGRTIGSTVNLTTIDRVTTVRVDNVDLALVPWRSLKYHDPHWLTTLGSSAAFWAPIGRMLFAVLPGPTATRAVTVVGPKITTTLSATSTAIELRDAHMSAVLNIVEQVLLLRQRLFASAQKAGERRPFISRIGNVQ